MADRPSYHQQKPRRGKGFTQASGLVQSQIRKASEGRGFAVTRLLTHWEEVVGQDIAAICLPVKIGYGRGGLGATLTVLARGAAGPMLQPQLPRIRDRVNACYGYNAVARITVTQTAPTGFSEGQSPFRAAPTPVRAAQPDPTVLAVAETATNDIADPELRAALAGLGSRILTRSKT
ncbi:DUF721 domain-containing protein [Pseudoruegeria sp. SK021]|uniref:DUF721 domain-containing protein n=1 Tax=Pseudoruegeria sp. SK021 TaxID=1933035 RepID=UPI000A231EFC|nr:DUF721 domain-containing protein [Pseudoruegeria sp. SK021]OSP55073.1 RNA-binding protein [Pseudoruegeria sp. SK021]